VLPDNLLEVQHRARDIMFSDKYYIVLKCPKQLLTILGLSMTFIKCSRISLIQTKKKIKRSLKRSVQDIKKSVRRTWSRNKGVYYITRSEPFPSLYENADFSVDTVKVSIKDGELKTNQKLKDMKMS
jgi:NTE family protein